MRPLIHPNRDGLVRPTGGGERQAENHNRAKTGAKPGAQPMKS
jgi:hypothetical protein